MEFIGRTRSLTTKSTKKAQKPQSQRTCGLHQATRPQDSRN